MLGVKLSVCLEMLQPKISLRKSSRQPLTNGEHCMCWSTMQVSQDGNLDAQQNNHLTYLCCAPANVHSHAACIYAALLNGSGTCRLMTTLLPAGYTWDGVIHKMPNKQWQAMLDVHLTAPFRLIQAAAPFMRDAAKAEMERDGKAVPRSIINVSSTSGTHGNAGQVNYGTVCNNVYKGPVDAQ